MKKSLVEKAEADRRAEAMGHGLPGLRPDDPHSQAEPVRGQSGVPFVEKAQEKGKTRPNPWVARTPGSKATGGNGYVSRVASVAEGRAVLEAWQHVGQIVRDRADVKACRATARRMAADLIDGQAVLPLGDGLEGWLPKPEPDKGQGG